MAEKPTLDRDKLMKEIQICSLAVFEAALYLDTHKTDKEALAYHKKHGEMLAGLKKEYTENFGPLTLGDNKSSTSWTWTDAPWPWEI